MLSINSSGSQTQITMGETTIYFSYKTPIAIDWQGKMYVHQNDWSVTTGKHLNNIDGGSKEAKTNRLNDCQFSEILQLTKVE